MHFKNISIDDLIECMFHVVFPIYDPNHQREKEVLYEYKTENLTQNI